MKTSRKLMQVCVKGAIIGTVLLSSSAFAGGIELSESPINTTRDNGLASGQLTLPVNHSPYTANFWSGFQQVSLRDSVTKANLGSFEVFCVDPYQWSPSNWSLYTKATFTAANTSFSSGQIASINHLYSAAYASTLGPNSVATDKNAAAFQLALWELVADYGNVDVFSTNYSGHTPGFVHATGSTIAGLANDANAMLVAAAAWSAPDKYSLTIYKNASNQDYLVATPVPEPETYAMFLAGLGLMGFVARRKAAKQ